LVILRHAKADRPNGVADEDRPLSDRGHADAAAAGVWLVDAGLLPELVLCSPARRTRQTWHGVALGLPVSPAVRYDPVLYGGSARTLLAAVRSAAPEAFTLLLIGHNPGLSDLSATLDPDRADSDGLRTAGIAVHAIDGDWIDVAAGQARLAAAHTARAPS
jgi:phosphohistidine phosphatase